MATETHCDEIELQIDKFAEDAVNKDLDKDHETRIELPDEGATGTETKSTKESPDEGATVTETKLPRTFAPIPTYLRIIKWTALFLIGACVLVGTVLSKVSLVSITGRMFNLTRFPDEHALPRSVLFIQLTFFLVIPEVVSFIRCLVWGVIGKTTESFPWPTLSAFVLVSLVGV